MSLPSGANRGANDAEWDAIVVGAGPAGAVAARRLALDGASVLLVDKKAFPRQKVCGACLNRDALETLEMEGLGALVDGAGAVPLSTFSVSVVRRTAQFPLPPGRALSREKLDAGLVAEAIAAGATFVQDTFAIVEAGARLDQTRAVRLDRRGETSRVRARAVIVAGGLGHRALDLVPGIKTHVATSARIGAGCEFRDFPDDYPPGVIHMAVGRGGYVGLVQVENNRLNVGAAFDRSFVRAAGTPGLAAARVLAEAGLPEIPALADAPWHGTVGLTQRTRPVALHRLMLIGDATGYVEPFTGQGMACALASARAVAPLALRAIESWSAALEREWCARHHALNRRRLWLCSALAWAARRPLAARTAFALAARSSNLSGFLMNHVNAPPILVKVSGTCR
jgi:flavin-dependent dehydrogenase